MKLLTPTSFNWINIMGNKVGNNMGNKKSGKA